MITLYGSGQSRSFRALWALEEADIPYEYKQVKIGKTDDGGTQTDKYKQLNIQGKVPTLVDGDFVLTESAAILNYIARSTPDKKLIPFNSNMLQAKYDQVCYFVLSELEQPMWTLTKHMFVLPKDMRVKLSQIKKITVWEFEKATKTLAHFLGDNEFIIDNRFTMADILVTYTLHWAKRSKFNVPSNLVDYSNRMYERKACQRALSKA